MRPRPFLALLAILACAPAQASERIVLDGVAMDVPAGYGVAGDEPRSMALDLRSVQSEGEASLRRGESYRVALRDLGGGAGGPVLLMTAVPDAGSAEAAVPASIGSVGNLPRWLGRPERTFVTDRFERRDYWVRTGIAQAPLAHVSCGEDGCRVGARLSQALSVEIMHGEFRETADLQAQAAKALRSLLFPSS